METASSKRCWSWQQEIESGESNGYSKKGNNQLQYGDREGNAGVIPRMSWHWHGSTVI